MHPELNHPEIGHAGIERPGAGHAGVGLLFNGALTDLLGAEPDAVEFLSVIPERFWQDFGRDRAERFAPLPDEVAILDAHPPYGR